MEKHHEKPSESEPLAQSMMATLKESNLRQILETGAELSVDLILDEGLLRDLPVVSTLVGLLRAGGAAYRDRLLLRKLCRFLRELADVEPTKRKQMISRLEQGPEQRRSVGENLILLLDRLDRMEKAEMVGKAFRAYCTDAIDRHTLERLTIAVDRILLIDLPQLRRFCLEWETTPFDWEILQNFINAGLAISQSALGGSHAEPIPLCRTFIEHVLGEKLEP